MEELYLQFVEERIAELLEQNELGFWTRLWGRKRSAIVTVAPKLPKYDFIRLEQCLEGLAEQIGDEEGFPISSLVSLLLMNFIEEPRTKPGCKKWLTLKKQFLAHLEPVMEWKQLSENHWGLRESQRQITCFRIPMEIPRRSAIQTELAILEFHSIDPDFDLSLEDMLSLLLLAFLDLLRTGKHQSFLKELFKRYGD